MIDKFYYIKKVDSGLSDDLFRVFKENIYISDVLMKFRFFVGEFLKGVLK